MKNLILKTVLFSTALSGVFTSCVNDDDYSVPTLGCVDTTLTKTMEVSAIPFGANISQYTDEDVVEAYVVSSDRDGNFFKSISMQTLDGSQAFSVSVDVTSTFINFEPGRKVLLNLKDLYIHNNTSGNGAGGKLIGSIYIDSGNGEVSVGRMPEGQFISSMNRSCTSVDEDDLVQTVKLRDVAKDEYLNKLIEFEDVQFSDDAIVTTYFDSNNEIGGATNHTIMDKFGTTLIFRTSSYSSFANKNVKTGSGKIRGVLTKYGTDYQLIVRNEDDIMLNSNRFVVAPVFFEDMQTATNNTNFNFPNWTNYAESGTYVWREKTFSGNGYAEFSAFGAQASNVAWLITPSIDLTGFTEKAIKFDVAQHHLDIDDPQNSLEILISTDYNGTNVLAATWTPLVANNLPTTQTAWYEFLNNFINLSDFNGNVHIAFKFRGSNNLLYDGAFQVDNVAVFGY